MVLCQNFHSWEIYNYLLNHYMHCVLSSLVLMHYIHCVLSSHLSKLIATIFFCCLNAFTCIGCVIYIIYIRGYRCFFLLKTGCCIIILPTVCWKLMNAICIHDIFAAIRLLKTTYLLWRYYYYYLLILSTMELSVQ